MMQKASRARRLMLGGLIVGLLAIGVIAFRASTASREAIASPPGAEDFVLVSDSTRTYHDLECFAADSAFDADFRALATSVGERDLTIDQINVVVDSFLVERTGYTGMSFEAAVAEGYTAGSVC